LTVQLKDITAKRGGIHRTCGAAGIADEVIEQITDVCFFTKRTSGAIRDFAGYTNGSNRDT
jgi:hypothetical protein